MGLKAVCNLELYLNSKQLTKSLGMVDKGLTKGMAPSTGVTCVEFVQT